MERLTHERVNGIKTGYWSAATKEVLVQKLAAYENTGYEPDEIRTAIEQAAKNAEAKAVLENVVEEMADVQIMLDQLRIIFGRSTAEIEEDKLRRLLRRINSYKESNIRKWLNGSFKPGDWWSRTVNTEAHPHEEGAPEK